MGESKNGVATPSSELSATAGPWGRFWRLMSEPWTLLLLLASIALFVIGQQKLSASVTALVQILLAVASGVLGARVTNLLETASSKNILEARGRVAVRGLRLMLVQTAAFQRRIQNFLGNRSHIESEPEVTQRNYEEAIEFCRRIQEEAASAMENWADVVPSADLSSLIGRITEAEEDHEATKRELRSAKDRMASLEQQSEDAVQMKGVIEALEKLVEMKESRIERLSKKLSSAASEAPRKVAIEAWKNRLAELSDPYGLDRDMTFLEMAKKFANPNGLDSDDKK